MKGHKDKKRNKPAAELRIVGVASGVSGVLFRVNHGWLITSSTVRR
jgi:hypothetical protein